MAMYALFVHRDYLQSLYRLSREEAGVVTAHVMELQSDHHGIGEIISVEVDHVIKLLRFGRYRVFYSVFARSSGDGSQENPYILSGKVRLLSLDWDE